MKLLRLSLVPFALLCVLVLRLLRGRVRIGMLWTNRIGHLAGNVEVHLCERDAGIRPKCLEIWAAPGDVCNKQLLKMWGRVLHIDRTGFTEIVFKVNKLFDGWQSIAITAGNLDRDVNNLWEQYGPHLKFTDKEEIVGKMYLQTMGIPPGAKWVCLIVRDKAYLPSLTYHDYRDSDIDTYTDAAKALEARGYYVIRMGAKVAKPMPYISRRVIDYATNGMRHEFMDIYLAAKCAFMISNGTGLDAVAGIFRRPICYVNYVPLEYLNTWNHSLAIWKHHEKDGKRMTPTEIFESGSGKFLRVDEYEQAGITLVDNSPAEIRAVVEEMADTVEGNVLAMDGGEYAFWQSFPRSISPYTQTPLHGEIRMRIGQKFLNGYTAPTVTDSGYSIPPDAHLMGYYG